MWCGASSSTRIHETVRHTWQFDLDSSNSFSVVLSSAVWNMSSRKKSVFVLFCCCFLLLCQPALLDTFLGPCVVLFFVFFCLGVVCFISQAIWLVSESNFAPVLPCPPPSPHRHTHIHTFPQTDTPPSHSKQINSSLAAHRKPQWKMAAHRSPENVQAVNVPCPLWLEEARFSLLCICVCVVAACLYVWLGLRGDGGRQWWV